MKKILPFIQQTPLQYFAFYIDYFGPLMGQGYDVRGLLYNNFISIAYAPIMNEIFFLSGFPPGRKIRKQYNRKLIRNMPEDPIMYIKKNIDYNRYAILMLDAQHMSEVPMSEEWFHEWLVYGYDDDEMIFHVSGYYRKNNARKMIYEPFKLNYDDFIKSLPPKGMKLPYMMKAQVFGLPDKYVSEKISTKKIKRQLFFYVNSIIPCCNKKVYQHLSKELLKESKGSNKNALQMIVVLCEHKNLILQMIQDITQNTELAKEYQSIVSMITIVKYLYIKISILGNNNTRREYQKIQELLFQIEKQEIKCMRKILKEI